MKDNQTGKMKGSAERLEVTEEFIKSAQSLKQAETVLDKLNAVLYYADENGNTQAGYPYNPNGSLRNIAGICDATGRIFALMPHPERFLRWTQHPRWTRETKRNSGDGLQVFVNAVDWAKRI